MDTRDVGRVARQAGDNDAVEALARVGYAVNGLMHLLIGWIALQLAFGSSAGSADQSGAFRHLASNGLGKALLWLSVAGFAGLAVWQISEAVRRSETGDRVKAAAKAVVYVAMAFVAFTFASGGTSSSSGQTKQTTRTLMDNPFGVFLVWAVALGIIGVGVYHIVKGAKKKFLSDLERHPGEAAEKLGQFGYIAKGVALAIVGGLFAQAAMTHNPNKSTGLDGALRTILTAPAGTILLAAAALGFVAYGLYSFARARHARV